MSGHFRRVYQIATVLCLFAAFGAGAEATDGAAITSAALMGFGSTESHSEPLGGFAIEPLHVEILLITPTVQMGSPTGRSARQEDQNMPSTKSAEEVGKLFEGEITYVEPVFVDGQSDPSSPIWQGEDSYISDVQVSSDCVPMEELLQAFNLDALIWFPDGTCEEAMFLGADEFCLYVLLESGGKGGGYVIVTIEHSASERY